MQGTRMSFRSKEDAVHFAEKQGPCTYQTLNIVMLIVHSHRLGLLCVCFYSSNPPIELFLNGCNKGRHPKSSESLPRITPKTLCTSPTNYAYVAQNRPQRVCIPALFVHSLSCRYSCEKYFSTIRSPSEVHTQSDK